MPKKTAINKAQLRVGIRFQYNAYYGSRCFIIGAGPSLCRVNLVPLNNEFTMVVNRGYKLRDLGLKKATFYGISDSYGFTEFGNEIDLCFARHYCAFGNLNWQHATDNLSTFDIYRNRFISSGNFQYDIRKPLYRTRTVVLYMLQVAVWAGFRKMYFLGIDNDFDLSKNIHWYKDSSQERKNLEGWDPYEENNMAFYHSHHLLKQKGINIYNATEGGKLESIPRVRYHTLI